MKKSINNRKQSGFTIIEVMIVLAIAGLIILIALLAVPALQRNNRNTQRKADAGKIIAMAQSCLGNNSGNVGSCAVTGATGVALGRFYDTSALSQLTALGSTGLSSATLTWGALCPGSAQTASTSSLTVQYLLEPNNIAACEQS